MTTASLVCTRSLTDRLGAAIRIELDKAFSWANDKICQTFRGNHKLGVSTRGTAKLRGVLIMHIFAPLCQVTTVSQRNPFRTHQLEGTYRGLARKREGECDQRDPEHRIPNEELIILCEATGQVS